MSIRSRHQRGWLTFEVGAALAVSSLAAALAWQATTRAEDAKIAGLQAEQLLAVRSAAHRLVMQNYSAYQAGSAVAGLAPEFTGVTLAPGTLSGQADRPTVANLRAMGFAPATLSDRAFFKGLQGVGFDLHVQRSAACATAPGSPGCTVSGLACFAQPYNRFGGAAGETDAHGLGSIMTRLGSAGLVSLPNAPAQLRRMIDDPAAGALPANPLAGTPAYAICAAFGWGSEGDDYLRLEESRDPRFRGNVSVAGALTASSLGVGTGTRADGSRCSLAEILSSGQVISRSGTCIQRVFMDGSTGAITSSDASGAARAGIRYNGLGQSEVYADNLLNNAGTAGIRSDGGVFGTNANFTGTTTMGNAVLNATAAIGAACSPDGGMSWTVQGTRWVLARCTGGAWTTTSGFREGSTGSSCGATNGVPGIDPSGALLICQGGSWVSMLERSGRAVFMASTLVQNGSVVPRPTCLSGSSGTSAFLALGSEQQAIQAVNRYITQTGANWTVSIVSETGAPIPGEHVLMAYCLY